MGWINGWMEQCMYLLIRVHTHRQSTGHGGIRTSYLSTGYLPNLCMVALPSKRTERGAPNPEGVRFLVPQYPIQYTLGLEVDHGSRFVARWLVGWFGAR